MIKDVEDLKRTFKPRSGQTSAKHEMLSARPLFKKSSAREQTESNETIEVEADVRIVQESRSKHSFD